MRTISGNVEMGDKLRSGWVSPARRKLSSDLKWSYLSDYLRMYCENSSLNGYKYLTESGRHWIERTIWIIVHVTVLCAMGYIVRDVYTEYKETPIVTTVDSNQYPSSMIFFPGIALCTMNRISYKAAKEFAEQIVNANVSRLTIDEVLDLLKYLGNLYDYSYESHKQQQQQLNTLLTEYFKGTYDVTDIMRDLAPKCPEILTKCSYGGDVVGCTDIFTFRKTQDGYCCTFNYARENDLFISAASYNGTAIESKIMRVKSLGVTNGLTLVIEPLLDDYYYSVLPIRGWKVILFNSEDYPDLPSGGVVEEIVTPLTETFLRLDAISFYSHDEIKHFPTEKRNCLFATELKKFFAGYTYSDCIVNCRVDDIWKTCGCIPFYLPTRDNRRTCGLEDIRCLNIHRTKWWAVFPHGVNNAAKLSSRYQDGKNSSWSLHCNECYPACNDVRYYVQSSVANLQPGHFKTNLMHNVTVVDQSIVHIFFSKHGTIRLRQDVLYYWYELLSNIGGICGVFLGFSLISVVELIYFLLMPLFSSLRTRVEDRVDQTEKIHDVDTTLYWGEFHPHKRKRRRRSRLSSRRMVY